jgi:two-component system, chemotaxis family, response regulator Rcp1
VTVTSAENHVRVCKLPQVTLYLQLRDHAYLNMAQKKLLVIEDSEADVVLMTIALDGAGLEYSFSSIRDGAQAVEYVRDRIVRADSELPDIVLLDLNVPKVDGLEILTCIRAADRFAAIPVIVLSSSQSPAHKRAVLGFSGTDFVVKPSDLDGFMELGKRIKSLLDQNGALSQRV